MRRRVLTSKFDVRRHIDHLIADVYQSGVKVRFKEATPENIDAFGVDIVVLAAGAKAAIPPIPGIGNKKVIPAFDLLAKKCVPTGEDIVVLGRRPRRMRGGS